MEIQHRVLWPIEINAHRDQERQFNENDNPLRNKNGAKIAPARWAHFRDKVASLDCSRLDAGATWVAWLDVGFVFAAA